MERGGGYGNVTWAPDGRHLVGSTFGGDANFDVYEGQTLVAEASNERIAGSIVIQRAMRLQAPLPVPQTHDPPLVIRFAIQK